MMNRQDFLKSAFGTALALTGADALARSATSGALAAAPFTLPPLPYANNALEPAIDALTMEIHHDRHHKAYVDNLNKAVEGTPLAGKTLEELFKGISKHPAAVRNNGGGHWNHTFFWTQLQAPVGERRMGGRVADAIDSQFGMGDKFKEEFKKAALGRFGSGWVWLVAKKGKLLITSTANQDNPLMDTTPEAERGTPLLGLDVWEHAYYLKYQNKRADYVDNFWSVINWPEVSKRFEAAK